MASSRRLWGQVHLEGWLVVIAVTALAEAAVRVFDLQDSVAAPSAAFGALADGLAGGKLSGELGATLESYVEGLGLAIVVGVAAGLAIGSSDTLDDASFVVIEFLRPIPAVALIPILMLFFGFETPMRRLAIAFAAVWPILVHTIYGVRGSDRFLHDVARTSGVAPAGRLLRVTLPAALPSIATGIRVSASLALLVCVTAEYVTGTSGLGAFMGRQQDALHLPEMYAAVILVGAFGYLVNAALRVVERRAVFWVGEERTALR